MEEKEIKKKIAEKIKEIEEAAAEKPVEKGLPSDKDIPVAEDQPAAKAKPDDDNQSVDKDKPAAEEQPAGENQQAAADKPAEEDRPADADKPADEKQSDDADKPDDKGTPFAEDHQPAADKPADEKQQAAKKRKSGKKKGLRLPSLKNPSRRAMRILLLLEILFLSLVVLVFTRSVSLNKDDRILPADAGTKDTVSCMDGSLTVNNITTKVPSKGNVVYNIAYSWGKNDTDHPSVPHAAVATYSNDSGRSLFELSLYRDSYTPKRKIPKGKNLDFSRDVFPAMLARGDALYGDAPEGYWCDIGDCGAYLKCVHDALEGRKPDVLVIGGGISGASRDACTLSGGADASIISSKFKRTVSPDALLSGGTRRLSIYCFSSASVAGSRFLIRVLRNFGNIYISPFPKQSFAFSPTPAWIYSSPVRCTPFR